MASNDIEVIKVGIEGDEDFMERFMEGSEIQVLICKGAILLGLHDER